MTLLLCFFSTDWRVSGKYIKNNCIWKNYVSGLFFLSPWRKTGRRKKRNNKEGIDTKTFRWNTFSEKHLFQYKNLSWKKQLGEKYLCSTNLHQKHLKWKHQKRRASMNKALHHSAAESVLCNGEPGPRVSICARHGDTQFSTRVTAGKNPSLKLFGL